ncbi:MAG: hypothetical protein JWM12_4239, partial [Ilumatobacteraceae bacterium]|nr:hypothetical protein [Ilumatobacteraceae bacterium]
WTGSASQQLSDEVEIASIDGEAEVNGVIAEVHHPPSMPQHPHRLLPANTQRV